MAHKPPAEYIKSNLKDLSPDFTGEKLFYAVGGTWRTIAYCHQLSKNKKSYNLENYRVAAKEMIEFADKLSKCSGKTLIEKYHVEHTRAELLPYSALMLAKLLKKVKAKTIIFTSTSLREGKLMEILKS